MTVFAVTFGDIPRLIYGYDSFGNTCNQNNVFNNETSVLSGIDTTEMMYFFHFNPTFRVFCRLCKKILFRNVFFFDVLYPKTSVEICVKSCPDKALMTPEEVLDFYKRTRSKLCRYDIKPKDYLNEALYAEDGTGPCPKLPVFAE